MVAAGGKPLTYKDAGVDIDLKTRAMRTVAALARSTHGPQVLTGIGSFGSLFRADFAGLREPVLVSSTDGVGTKLMVARRVGRFDTVGADLVNHCVNDILVMGAEPLFFLDYIAAGKLTPDLMSGLLTGFANACREQGVALVGGETAEMPGLYRPEDFDLAGFIVGVVDRSLILAPERVRAGDALVGLHSSGLHTNGYSLAQRIFFDRDGLSPDDPLPGTGTSLGNALLAVHRCYLPPLRGLLRDPALHAMAHITGGGFTENLPRVLPESLDAVIDRSAWEPPALFREIARRGPVQRDEMDRTFNMGIGMVLIVDGTRVEHVRAHLREQGENPVVIGRVERGSRRVRYEGERRQLIRRGASLALLLLALASRAQDAPADPLAELAAQGRWEDLLGATADRLAEAPGDVAALYWSGRAHLERGRALLAGSRFAQELGRSLLHRAAEQLVSEAVRSSFADAADWALFARYIAGDDETLAAELEQLADGGSGYAARLRGLLARDRGEPGSTQWLARAAAALPDDPQVRLEWAAELAARGERDAALAALEEARGLGADRSAWLATLLAALPGAENAEELLARLQPLLEEPGAERDAGLAWYRSWALEEAGRLAEAEAVLAAATEGVSADVQRAHARLLLRCQRPQEAATLAAPLAEAGDADALELLISAADALAQAFQWDESLAVYDRVLAIEPAHERAAANRALTQARAGHDLQGYRDLVLRFPARADLLNDAALAEAGRGHLNKARALLQRAVLLPADQPGARDARENLAALLLSGPSPDPAMARPWLEDLLVSDPGRDRALSLRALALRQLR